MRCGFFCPDRGTDTAAEELDVVSANAMYTEDSPPQSHVYDELVEVGVKCG